MFYKKTKIKGSMMIEIIVATSIITIFVLAALNVAQKSIVISNRAINATQAAFLLEEGAESVRIFRDNNTWTNFTNFFQTNSNYCLSDTVFSWTSALPTTSPCTKIGIFTRIINVEDVNRDISSGDIVSSGGSSDTGTKLFTVTVSWEDGGSVTSRNIKFYMSNIF